MSSRHDHLETGDLTVAFVCACEAAEAAASELADALDCWAVGDDVAPVHAASGLVVDAASTLLRDVTLSWTCDRDRLGAARALTLAKVSLADVLADLEAHPARRLGTGHVRDVARLADQVVADWLRVAGPAPAMLMHRFSVAA